MTTTIGSFTTTRLTAQPFGYEGTAREGLTARTFRISGLLSKAEWQALISEYNTWRNLRIADEDTLLSGVVGTTVNVTTDLNGVSISALACWFAEAPSGEQVGTYIQASVTMVDAAQALQVLLREQEKNRDRNEATRPSLGTVTFGSAVVTLTEPMETRQDGPNVTMTAGGYSYITGALAAHEVRNVRGYISTGTYTDLLTWYDDAVDSLPTAGSWFPTAPPSATAEVIVDGGVKSTRYNVTLTVVKIR